VAVELDHLTLVAGGRPLVDDVTLRLAAGGVHGIVGRNGSGKSALLACLAGLLPPTQGTVRTLGQPPGARCLRGRVAVLFQDEEPYPSQRVSDYLKGYAQAIGGLGNNWLDSVAEFIRHLSPIPLGSMRLDRLSPGQRRAVAIARALLGRPELLLLDDPFDRLDAIVAVQVARRLEAVAAGGATVVVATNGFAPLAACATTCWVVRDRGLVEVAAEVAPITASLAEATP